MTYVHQCPGHGDFDHRCPVADRRDSVPCPTCGTASRRVLRLTTAQFHQPGHFMTTLPTTGLKDGQGRSGGFENLRQEFNRWDSGCRGVRNDAKTAKLTKQREALDRAGV